jgi:phosphoserine aminotransferase
MSLPSPFTIFPHEMLAQMEEEFWNFNQTGFCFAELSHRSQHYNEVNERAQKAVKTMYGVGEDYEVLFLPAGCGIPSLAFNLGSLTGTQAVYVVRDQESQFAFEEASKILGSVRQVDSVEAKEELVEKEKFEGKFYTFYRLQSFEQGLSWESPQAREGELLVCSINKCAHYQQVDISKHAIVLFESGRGLGLTGMDILIVRGDLIAHHLPSCPDMMDYDKTLKAKSVINTPYTFVPLLILKHIEYLLSKGFTQASIKQKIKSIKQEF